MFGHRLRLARKREGLSMQALAERVSPRITAQAIGKYEAGKMMPSSSVLVGIGKALNVSLDFLFGAQVKTLHNVEWRKSSNASARDRARAEVLVIEKLENHIANEEILGLGRVEDPFSGMRVHRLADERSIDAIAAALRDEWKIGIAPIPSMISLLEEKGLKIIEAELPEGVDGMACQVERANALAIEAVVVAKRANVERKRFNLAHELAHRIIIATGNSSMKKVRAMNRFAGAFLVPREHLAKQAGEIRRSVARVEIMRLKRYYGVSAAAMLMRLGQAGILSEAAVQYAFKTYARNWRREEPEPIDRTEGYSAFERPRRFEQLVWRAIGERLISPARAAQLLGRPLRIVEDEIRGPRDQCNDMPFTMLPV